MPRRRNEDGQIEFIPRPMWRELSTEDEDDVEQYGRGGGGRRRAVSEDDRRGADCFAVPFTGGEGVLALSPAGGAQSCLLPSAASRIASEN
jgi:hypothetical protein